MMRKRNILETQNELVNAVCVLHSVNLNKCTNRSKYFVCILECVVVYLYVSTQSDTIQSKSTFTHSILDFIPLWMKMEWNGIKAILQISLKIGSKSYSDFSLLPLKTMWTEPLSSKQKFALSSKQWNTHKENSQYTVWQYGNCILLVITIYTLETICCIQYWSVPKTLRQLHYKGSVYKHQIKSWPISECSIWWWWWLLVVVVFR